MSSLLGVSKELIWSKFRPINLTLLINIILVGIIIGITKFDSIFFRSFPQGLMIISATVFFILGIVILVNLNEKVLSSNRYRLIPISESQLYFSNLLTSGLIYFYFCLIESIIFLGSLYYYMRNDVFYHTVIDDNIQFELLLKDITLIFLAVVLIWTGSTLVHLLMNYINDFLQIKSQKLLYVIFNLLIIAAALVIIFWTLTEMSKVGMYRYTDVPNNIFPIVCLVDVIGILISIFGGLYLLENQAETER
ncbi:hypothetical protein CPR19088_GLDEOEPO_01816 [Companilactobacillus paralimentarius]